MTLQQPFGGNNPLTIAKNIVDGEFEPIEADGFYSEMLLQIVARCMTAAQEERPNITELCQMMVDVLMQQIDFLRIKEQLNLKEIKQLRDKVRYYEGPTSTGFRGFNTTDANVQLMGVTQNTNI